MLYLDTQTYRLLRCRHGQTLDGHVLPDGQWWRWIPPIRGPQSLTPDVAEGGHAAVLWVW
jgi:hypothetical protein